MASAACDAAAAEMRARLRYVVHRLREKGEGQLPRPGVSFSETLLSPEAARSSQRAAYNYLTQTVPRFRESEYVASLDDGEVPAWL